MKKSYYKIESPNFNRKIKLAIVADLHGGAPQKVIKALTEERPDYILMPGDIFEELDGINNEKYRNGLELLRESVKIAPTFFSAGNHEDGATRSWAGKWRKLVKERDYNTESLRAICETGTHILLDEYEVLDGIAFGGLLTGLIYENKKPELKWLDEFCAYDGPKVLLCHHPEYYKNYLSEMPIDIVVSGHAHGGQWRFFGRGVFAPGQGLFPKYTSGVYENRLVVSRGLKKDYIPRFFNPTEVVFVTVN